MATEDVGARLERTPSMTVPGVLLGLGLGGCVDGIVLHQILQWHHMLTSEGSYPKTTVVGLEGKYVRRRALPRLHLDPAGGRCLAALAGGTDPRRRRSGLASRAQ